MPRPAKGARLYADKARGQWIIRDGAQFLRIGCALDDRAGADKALAHHLAQKYLPGNGPADDAPITDVLIAYLREHAAHTKAPASAAYAVKALQTFWADKTLQSISGVTCRAYGQHRTAQDIADGTIRRELATLNAAINHWHREHGPLRAIPTVTMPPPGAARQRWLDRGEAAALLIGAMGGQCTACNIKTRRPSHWQRDTAAAQLRHIARFVLIGLRTGTRYDAITRLQWLPNTQGGWIDVDRGVLYRKSNEQGESNKKATPVRLNPKFLPTLRRWRAADMARGITHVINYHGDPVSKLRKTWARATAYAHLGPDVTPHIMRHTRCTWLMQAGVPIQEAAASVGMSALTFEKVYAHHHPDFQSRAAAV